MAAALKQHQLMKFSLQSRHVLTADETELYELVFLAGVTMDPNVFKIILDLLKMNVAPMAIMQMLKSLRNRQVKKKGPSSVLSTSSNDSSNSKPHGSRSEPTGAHRSESGPALQPPPAAPTSRSRPSSTRPDSRPPSTKPDSRPASTRPDRPPSRSRASKNTDS